MLSLMLDLSVAGLVFLRYIVSFMFMYFSPRVRSSVTDFREVFDKDILNASHLITYIRAEIAAVICRLCIWSLSA